MQHAEADILSILSILAIFLYSHFAIMQQDQDIDSEYSKYSKNNHKVI